MFKPGTSTFEISSLRVRLGINKEDELEALWRAVEQRSKRSDILRYLFFNEPIRVNEEYQNLERFAVAARERGRVAELDEKEKEHDEEEEEKEEEERGKRRKKTRYG